MKKKILLIGYAALLVVIAVVYRSLTEPVRQVSYPVQIFTPQQLAQIQNDYNQRRWIEHLEITCMAITMYGEAKGSSEKDLIAVGFTMINRTHDELYPSSTCLVALQKYQYEPIATGTKLYKLVQQTINGHPQLPSDEIDQDYVQHIYQLASDVYYYTISDPTNGATHFYSAGAQKSLGRVPPIWSHKYQLVAVVGQHRYYVKNTLL